MAGVAAVGVDDDLATREAGVSHGSADRERARAIHEVRRPLVEPGVADGRSDHSLADVVAEPLVFDAGVVLRRDDHRVDAPGHAPGVLDGDLALPVRPQVRERTALAGPRELARDVVRERDRERHELGRLADREAEHHPLIAGAELLGIDPFARLDRLVHALRDLRRLLLDRGDDAAGPVVEAVIGVRVPDLVHDPAHEARDVDVGVGRDLAGDEDDARRRGRLAGHARVRVLAEALVEHRVGDLVAQLVGVALGDGLAGEEDPLRRHE